MLVLCRGNRSDIFDAWPEHLHPLQSTSVRTHQRNSLKSSALSKRVLEFVQALRRTPSHVEHFLCSSAHFLSRNSSPRYLATRARAHGFRMLVAASLSARTCTNAPLCPTSPSPGTLREDATLACISGPPIRRFAIIARQGWPGS